MLREHPELFRELGRFPDVIGIEEADVVPPRVGQPEIPGGAHSVVPAVGVLHQPDPMISCCVAEGDLPACVRGTVIDDDELPIVEALPLDARDRLVQEGLAVVDDDDAGYGRWPHLHARWSRRTRLRSWRRTPRALRTGAPATVSGAWRAREIPWIKSDP